MKTLYKMRFIPLLLVLLLVGWMVIPAALMADEPVELGTTEDFAVLAGETITNTGPTTITGDVGLDPGTAFTGQADVTLDGTVHVDDAVAEQAKEDLVIAYDDAAGRTPTEIPTELGGTTLNGGTYDSADGTFQITGTLTLDGQNNPDSVFVFQTATTLITADNSVVDLINGVVFCHVFWQVGSSATLGVNSEFVGHILALTSITANTGATVEGQLLARDGSVTLDSNTITNEICEETTPPDETGGDETNGDTTEGDTTEVDTTAIDTTAVDTTEVDTTAEDTTESEEQLSQANLPLINVIITTEPLALISGPDWVTYTYEVTNPGMVELSNIIVTDDKVSPVSYVSGDVNTDNLLQPNETWIYTGKMYLNETMTNTVLVSGSANGTITVAMATTTADVTNTGGVTKTVTGGQLPKTATPWHNILLAGAALMLIGVVGLITRKKIYE